MLQRISLCLLFLSGFFLPSVSFAQQIPFEAPVQDEGPIAIIKTPADSSYTRIDRILPAVTFASTSQIVDVEYVLNETYVPYDKPLPFFDQPLGTTTFSVVTKDTFGVTATTSVTFQLEATVESTAGDIREAFKRGLITKGVIRDRFLRSLELYADAYDKRVKLLGGTDKRKDERAALLSERMSKILDNEILDLLKKQEGRTMKKEGADMLRENIGALKKEAGL